MASIGKVGERVFNVGLAFVLLIPFSVIILLVYIVYLLTCRKTGPFFYKGHRLGRHKEIFNIYKIRTLVKNAETQIGAKLYANDSSKELWYGGFLRKTRIDELPQLINVLRGEMDFVGPRPVRPQIYDSQYSLVSGVENRFKVRPGLTGYSQFYTPHGAPARLRVKIDNYFINKNVGIINKLLFVFRTAFQFILQLGDELLQMILRTFKGYQKKGYSENRRRFRRKKVLHALCELHPHNQAPARPIISFLVDIDNDHILLESPEQHELSPNQKLNMAINYKASKKGKTCMKTIHCEGEVVGKRERAVDDPVNKYVINYTNASEIAMYALHKHLLKSSYAG